ncbi:MAG: hypothetical protein ACTSQO_02735 [Candidatus Helarchaeota archaeon]
MVRNFYTTENADLKNKRSMCIQTIEKNIKIEGLLPRLDLFEQVFLNEMEMRNFIFINKLENGWTFKKQKFLDIKINYKIDDEDIWFNPKVGLSTSFIVLVFITIGALACIIFLNTILYFFNSYNFGEDNYLDSFMIFLIPIFSVFVIVLLLISFGSTSHIYGLPNYPLVRYSIQNAIHYSADNVLTKGTKVFSGKKICPSCNREVRPNWKICAYCGFRL